MKSRWASCAHSCAHVMARAIMRLFDGVQLAFGPTIDGGYYYDFDLEHSLTDEDFPAIEAEMKKIIKLNEPFVRLEEPREKAVEICRDLEQAYKVEHIQDGLSEDPTLSFYQQGEFLDLCRGPHIPGPKAIGAFKLLSVAGAYWKGDSARHNCSECMALHSSTSRTLKNICSGSKKPNVATIECSASNSNYSRLTRSSDRGSSCGCRRAAWYVACWKTSCATS